MKKQNPRTSWIILLSLSLWSAGFGQTIDNSGIDVLHYNFTIAIPDSGNFIDGVAVITARRFDSAQQLRLDLVGLDVDSVRVNGSNCLSQHDKVSISVPLPVMIRNEPDTVSVFVKYHGHVRDGLIIRRDSKGRWTAFGDNWPERARYWLPCIDRPSDKATVEWNVITSPERQVVANGVFMLKTAPYLRSGEPKVLTVWKESKPIPTYLMVIAAGPFVRFDLEPLRRPLNASSLVVQQSVYVMPEILDYLPGSFKYAGDIVDYFSKLLGLFPYEKLAHVQSSTRYGGMENASAIFYANDGFERRNMKPGIIAHETAHQWFGDAVTEKEWSHLWLSEGFATYFEELWTKHEFGDSAFQSEMIETRSEIIRAREVRQRPVIDSLETNLMALLNTNSYQKGAWILHMLHSILGDSIFFRSLRSYLDMHQDSNATTDDLEEEFEKTSHQNQRWFFDQWLRRPGYPRIETSWTYDDKSGNIELSIRQSGQFGTYRFPLIVETIAQNGARFRDTLSITGIELTNRILHHTFTQKPITLRIDPDVDLLAEIVSH